MYPVDGIRAKAPMQCDFSFFVKLEKEMEGFMFRMTLGENLRPVLSHRASSGRSNSTEGHELDVLTAHCVF